MPIPPLRRWTQFSLATIFAVMTVFAIWLRWEMKFVHERQAYEQLCRDNGQPCWLVELDDGIAAHSAVPAPTIPIYRRLLGDKAILFVGNRLSREKRERGVSDEVKRVLDDETQRLFPEAWDYRRALEQKRVRDKKR